MLVLTTYKYVKILLASERIKTHSSERSLLKNLGSWLGRVTIAQGQPVRHKDLDVKGIIIDAFEQGKMIAVLPFVNKASHWLIFADTPQLPLPSSVDSVGILYKAVGRYKATIGRSHVWYHFTVVSAYVSSRQTLAIDLQDPFGHTPTSRNPQICHSKKSKGATHKLKSEFWWVVEWLHPQHES